MTALTAPRAVPAPDFRRDVLAAMDMAYARLRDDIEATDLTGLYHEAVRIGAARYFAARFEKVIGPAADDLIAAIVETADEHLSVLDRSDRKDVRHVVSAAGIARMFEDGADRLDNGRDG